MAVLCVLICSIQSVVVAKLSVVYTLRFVVVILTFPLPSYLETSCANKVSQSGNGRDSSAPLWYLSAKHAYFDCACCVKYSAVPSHNGCGTCLFDLHETVEPLMPKKSASAGQQGMCAIKRAFLPKPKKSCSPSG